MSKDYYSILGISKSASEDEIKKAFRKKAHEHHPDKGGDAKKFTDVNEAYQAGANSFLVKPVDFERFVEITSALSGYWMRADIPPETERLSQELSRSEPTRKD